MRNSPPSPRPSWPAWATLTVLLVVSAGCTAASRHGTAPTEQPIEVSAPPETAAAAEPPALASGDPGDTPPTAAPTAETAPLGTRTIAPRPGGTRPPCQLPAPKSSEDSCKTDADCGVSAPCHAPACVAKSKAQPPQAGTMCTRELRCDSADANRCGCYQGRCALLPPGT